MRRVTSPLAYASKIGSFIYNLCLTIYMRTTIQVTKETLLRLKSIKIAKRESYDEIVNRLIDNITKIDIEQ